MFSGYLALLEKRALRIFFISLTLMVIWFQPVLKGDFDFFFAEFCLSARVILKIGKLGEAGVRQVRVFKAYQVVPNMKLSYRLSTA